MFNKLTIRCCALYAQLLSYVFSWDSCPSPNPCTGAFCTGAHCMRAFLGAAYRRRGGTGDPCPTGRFWAIPRVRRTGRPVNSPRTSPSGRLAAFSTPGMCHVQDRHLEKRPRLENRKLEISSKTRNFAEISAKLSRIVKIHYLFVAKF